MIDLTGFSQGFTQRTDENRRSRHEFAKAFEEFKRNNPYASLEEFQSFIDQSTGGNNYLSAGAPSKKVLQQLADENAKRKLADVTRQQVADLSSRVRTQGELEALVDKSFLNSDINPTY
jgi:ATP-dependent exoDNAse (exonuclease V) beta subunit